MTPESTRSGESNTDTEGSEQQTSRGLTLSRRAAIGLIAAGATGAAIASGQGGTDPADAAIGGGPMADQAANLRALLYEGTMAERPTAGVAGRYFRVDDPGSPEHGDLYRDTGSGWDKADLGVSSVNEVEKVSPGENIQAAIDRVAAAGAGKVEISRGEYAQTITIPSRVTVEGVAVTDVNSTDEGTTLKRPDGVDAPVVTIQDGAGPVHGGVLRSVNVHGNDSGSGSGSSSHGVLVENPNRVRIKDCSIYSCAQAGVRSNSGIVLWMRDTSVRGCGSDGVFMSATSDYVLSGLDIGSNGRHGILSTGANSFIGDGTVVFSNGSDGIHLAGTSTRVSDVRSNDNTGKGIRIPGAGDDENSIKNCHLVNNSDGLVVTDSERTTVTGGIIQGNSNWGVYSDGTSDHTRVVGANIFNNGSGATSLTGSNSDVV